MWIIIYIVIKRLSSVRQRFLLSSFDCLIEKNTKTSIHFCVGIRLSYPPPPFPRTNFSVITRVSYRITTPNTIFFWLSYKNQNSFLCYNQAYIKVVISEPSPDCLTKTVGIFVLSITWKSLKNKNHFCVITEISYKTQ